MRPGRLRSALIAPLLLATACACGSNKTQATPTETPTAVTPTPTPALVTSFADVKASAGKLVRVQGKIQREKLGDTVILSDGLDILCPDFRVPDDVTEATFEGTLELWEPPVAGVDEQGQISQGVAEGTPARWVLRGCKQI